MRLLFFGVTLVFALSAAAAPDAGPTRDAPLAHFGLPILLGEQPDPMGMKYQLLPMVGREDLQVVDEEDAFPLCTPVKGVDPLEEIAKRAASAQIVIINEAHDQPRDRAFIAQMATRLKPLGFDVFAGETMLADGVETTSSWPSPKQGLYVDEPNYGNELRLLKKLGYRLVAYEAPAPAGAQTDPNKALADREEGQVDNLVSRIFAKDPKARVLIHVGHSHVFEGEVDRQGHPTRWMAARLKARLKIDPLTIDQTLFATNGQKDVVCAARRDKKPFPPCDLFIGKPPVAFDHHRPTWRATLGQKQVAIPRSVLDINAVNVVEARPIDEPDAAVPVDRVMVWTDDVIPLMLPTGRFRVEGWTRAKGWTAPVTVDVP